MNLTRTVDAAAELMTTAEAKTHLRVDTTTDDAYIDTLVKAARLAAEERTSRATTNQTWVLKLDAFPAGDEIRLPRPPLSSVTSLDYVDGDGANQTWATSNYTVVTGEQPGAIKLAYNVNWPTTRAQVEAVTITYVAGYGAGASAVPAAFTHAAKLIVEDLYDGQHKNGAAIETLLTPFVCWFHD